MKVIAELLDTKTFETVFFEDEAGWPGATLDDAKAAQAGLWSRGNYACDCNRHTFFTRAKGIEDGDDYPCSVGANRYIVIKVTVEGEVVHEEPVTQEHVQRAWAMMFRKMGLGGFAAKEGEENGE